MALVVGGMQFFVARQIQLLDGLRDSQQQLIARVISLEVEARYGRKPPPDAKEKP